MVKQTEKIRPTRVVGDVVDPAVDAIAAKVRPRLSEAAYLEKLLRMGKNGNGDEVPDPTPMEPPIGWIEPPSMVELIRKMIRDNEIEKGLGGEPESFEEADDFDIGDDGEDLRSGWENDFEPREVELIREKLEKDQKAAQAAKEAATAAKAAPAAKEATPTS